MSNGTHSALSAALELASFAFDLVRAHKVVRTATESYGGYDVHQGVYMSAATVAG